MGMRRLEDLIEAGDRCLNEQQRIGLRYYKVKIIYFEFLFNSKLSLIEFLFPSPGIQTEDTKRRNEKAWQNHQDCSSHRKVFSSCCARRIL